MSARNQVRRGRNTVTAECTVVRGDTLTIAPYGEDWALVAVSAERRRALGIILHRDQLIDLARELLALAGEGANG